MTRLQWIAAVAAAAMLAAAVLLFVVPSYIYHPLGVCTGVNCGYQFWSGIAGSFLLGGGIWTSALLFLWRHQCHQHGCLRIAFHEHPEHKHPVCKHHFPNEHVPGHPDNEEST